MKNQMKNHLNGMILSRDQMKKITGGVVAGGTCQVLLPSLEGGGTNWGGMNWGENGHSYGSMRHGSNGTLIAGISSADAQQAVSNGGRWCCASCGTASWAL